MPTTARAFLAILLAMVLAPAAAHADEVAPSTTPGLINEALTEGRISPERATVLRAQALDGDPALPAAYRSTDPWDGTTTMLQVQEGYDELSGTQRRAVGDVIADAGEQESCGADSTGALDTRLDSAHFRIDFAAGGVGGGLTADDYRDALEVAWAKQVDEYGWAAPPTASGLGGRVHVRISPLPGGLLGYVTNVGTHASYAGDNPNTAWDDLSAEATCMVLKANLSNLGGGTTPQGLLSSTTAHELNHTLQFGYGAAGSDIKPDAHMFEGGATFIEQDTQADDTALFRVPPYPHLSFGAFPDWADQYSMFYVLRGMAERFGVGTAGGQEQVMQDFWETLSRRQHGGQMGALEQAFALKGTTAGEAFHDYAITAKFLMPCGGGFPAGRCFEDAGIYRTKPRLLQPSRGGHGAADAGAPWTGEIEDDLTLNWIRLPWSASAFDVTLTNTSSGGALRATAACDAGGTLREMGALAPLTAGEDGTIEIADPAPCTTRPFLIVTNESTGTGNPDTSAKRSYTVSVDGPKRAVRMRWTTGSAGTGTITLAPAQGSPVDCTSDCTVDFDPGASITLTAAPNGTGRFLGFSGGGCSGTDPCVVTMSQAREIRAGFAPENPVDYGFYRVFPASEFLDMDIDTGPLPDYGDESWTQDCVAGTPMCATHQREVGSPFTLTAREAIGAGQRQRFRGWQGPGADDCVDAERACTFEIVSNINPSRSIIAVAETDSQLTWTQTGEGSIEILTMGDPSQYCSADCTVWINETNGPGIKVTPATGWRFVSFGEGQCERETLPSVCGVGAMGVPRAVHGTFERIPKHDLTVGLAGVGSGKVSSAPDGIDCGTTCSGAFEEGEEVTLTATPSDNASVFSSWSGACSGTSPTCTVTMSEARSVTADFEPAPTYALDVTVGGTGAGRVFSWGSTDIDCGTDCAESYLSGPTVTLLAHASAGSSFAGWGGACAGSLGPVCYVYMTEARAVTVFFDLVPSEPEPEPTPTPSPSPTPEPSTTPTPEPDPGSGAVPPTDEAPVIVPETPAFTDPVSPVISTLPPAEPPLADPPLAIAPKVTQPKQTMAAIIKQGVSLRLTAPVASTVTATLSVDKRVAKKLGLAVKGGRATAGAGTGTAGPMGGTLRVKLGAKAGKAAKKLKSFPALLTITTTSPGTAPKVSTRQVTVGR